MTGTTNPRLLVITKTTDEFWRVATSSPLAFVAGTSEMDVLIRCAKEGWALVSAARGTGGAATYYFSQTSSDPVADSRRPKVDLR
jgi:hypothetical protein